MSTNNPSSIAEVTELRLVVELLGIAMSSFGWGTSKIERALAIPREPSSAKRRDERRPAQ